MRTNKYEYDAFISHAVEDKIPIANELCARLEAAGLKIWYSGKELGVGDSIEKTIEKGLNRSRYGIVIFSPTYLAKNWTIREFYTLLAKEIEEQKVILPVLYNISLDELKKKDLVMADRFAVNAGKGMDFVVERLVREIEKSNVLKKSRPLWLSKIRIFFMLSLLANVALLSHSSLFSKRTPRVTPSASQYTNASPANAEAVMVELQGLLTQFSRCNCDQKGRRSNVRSGFTEAHAESFTEDRDGAPLQKANVWSATGKKMTMALIFHVEPAAYGGEGASRERRQAAIVREEQTPFVTAKSTDHFQPRPAEECFHAANFGD